MPQHTKISSTEITIDITMELSGKMISVYIDNPSLPKGSQFLSRPAYVLPRHSEITGTCKKCPTSTFSGSYGAIGFSACENTTTHTTAARRLLSKDESQLTIMSPVTFMEIRDQLFFVQGIQDNTAYPESDFSIDVVLQYSNFTFVQDNIAAIAKKVMETCNFNNVSIKCNLSFIRLHPSNASVIFGIYGNYTDAKIQAETNNFPIIGNNVSIEYNSTSILLNTSNASIINATYTDTLPIIGNNVSTEYNSISILLNTSNASVINATYTQKKIRVGFLFESRTFLI